MVEKPRNTETDIIAGLVTIVPVGQAQFRNGSMPPARTPDYMIVAALRPQVPALVARGRFDLDHVGAEVAQQRGRVRPGEKRRAIEDADAFEGAGGRLCFVQRSVQRSKVGATGSRPAPSACRSRPKCNPAYRPAALRYAAPAPARASAPIPASCSARWAGRAPSRRG